MKPVKASKKSLVHVGTINKEENGKVKTKRVLDDFKMPKL